MNGQPQASRTLAGLQDAWAADPEARDRLDAVLARGSDVLSSLGGLGTTDDVVAELTAETAGADASRVIAGLLRLALDRAEIVERGGGNRAPIARRRRRHRTQLLAATPVLLDVADELGARAEELVTAARAAGEDIVPVGRVAARLRSVWPASAPAPDDMRLARLAARMSNRAGASRRGELHDRDLDPASAVRIALGGLAPSQRMTVQDLAERVRARFPDLPPLPGRPRLDRVVEEAGLSLRWDGEAYAVPSRPADTTVASRASVIAVSVVSSPGVRTAEDARLAESVRSRSFLALAVAPHRLDVAAQMLVERYGAQVVDVTDVLLRALREEAARRSVPWDMVRAADAAEPGSRPEQGLAALVRAAVPAVEAAVAASAGGPEGSRPVLMVEAAPLARYGHTELLTRLADITLRRSQAVWLLLPEESGGGPVLDGAPLRLGHGGQFLRLNEDWLRTPSLKKESA